MTTLTTENHYTVVRVCHQPQNIICDFSWTIFFFSVVLKVKAYFSSMSQSLKDYFDPSGNALIFFPANI